MAAVLRRVAASNPTPNTVVPIYTVPPGRKAIVRTVSQGTDAASPGTTMVLSLPGGNLLSEVQVLAGASRMWPLGTVLNEGEQLRAFHSTGTAYTLVGLVELEASIEGAALHRVDLLDIVTERSYVVPNGKRFRIREVIISTANATTDVQVRIGNTAGYLVKMNTKEPAVVGTDIVAFPGEAIIARASGTGLVHAYLSGVLEDA